MPPKKPPVKKAVSKTGTAKKAPTKKKTGEPKKPEVENKPEVVEAKREIVVEKPILPMARNIKLKDMAKVLFEDDSLSGKPIFVGGGCRN